MDLENKTVGYNGSRTVLKKGMIYMNEHLHYQPSCRIYLDFIFKNIAFIQSKKRLVILYLFLNAIPFLGRA